MAKKPQGQFQVHHLVANPWKPFFAGATGAQNLETPPKPSARRKSMKFFDPGKKKTSFSDTYYWTQDGRKLERALFKTLLSIAFLHLVIPIIMVVESGASREPRRKRAKECSNLDGKGA